MGGMAASLQRAINPAGRRDEVGRERPGVGGVRLRLCRSKSRRRRSSGVCVLDENGAQDVGAVQFAGVEVVDCGPRRLHLVPQVTGAHRRGAAPGSPGPSRRRAPHRPATGAR